MQRPPKPSLPLIWLLMATVLLVDLVAVVMMRAPLTREWRFLLFGFVLAQVAVAVAWVVFGGWHLLVRLPAALVAISLLAHPLAHPFAQPAMRIEHSQWLGVLSIYGAGLMIILVFFWTAGLRVGAAQQDYGGARWLLGNRIWQFSLGSVLVAITSISIVLATMRRMDLPEQNLLSIVASCLGFGLVALAAMWAAMARGRVTLRLLTVLIVCPAIGAGLWLAEGKLYSHLLLLTAIAQTVTILALVHVVKVSGYELVWARGEKEKFDAASQDV